MSVFEASKLVSTETLLLKHDYAVKDLLFKFTEKRFGRDNLRLRLRWGGGLMYKILDQGYASSLKTFSTLIKEIGAFPLN